MINKSTVNHFVSVRLYQLWRMNWWFYSHTPTLKMTLRKLTPLPKCRPAIATAKSLQSCPTLCDPIDGSPLGSPVPGILQARTLELPFPSPMHESEK